MRFEKQYRFASSGLFLMLSLTLSVNAFADDNRPPAVPVNNPFSPVGGVIGPGGQILPPPAPPPVPAGYTCNNVDSIFISSGGATTNPTDISPTTAALNTSIRQWYVLNPTPPALTGVVVPAGCASPDSACNCLAMTLQNGSNCVALCSGSDIVCAKNCIATMQTGLAFCTSSEGFC
jgi:hypothetical protein